ncbi:MAG: formylglycine-generating enzyme family protein [Planctomycetaceae bacterium]|nr:formylglycine-generating enzyme family protein [Planctomycetaceae bacterium]
MKTTFAILLSICMVSLLSLPVLGQTPPPKDNRKAGEREELKIKGVEYAFRWCPAGTFQMGSPASETGRMDRETQHSVTLTKGFWMCETEVTQEQWKTVMGGLKNADGGDFEAIFFVDGKQKKAKLIDSTRFLDDKKPMVCVSWNDCQEFIKKLNGMGIVPKGYKFSLPTEAQWEYASRAGTTTAYCFGDDEDKLNDYAVYSGLKPGEWSVDKIKDKHTEPVKSKKPNQWNLYDMHGNASEWCLDWYADYPGGSVTDPMGDSTGTRRVFRDGSWRFTTMFSRSAFRSFGVPEFRTDYLGFRLALVSE